MGNITINTLVRDATGHLGGQGRLLVTPFFTKHRCFTSAFFYAGRSIANANIDGHNKIVACLLMGCECYITQIALCGLSLKDLSLQLEKGTKKFRCKIQSAVFEYYFKIEAVIDIRHFIPHFQPELILTQKIIETRRIIHAVLFNLGLESFSVKMYIIFCNM